MFFLGLYLYLSQSGRSQTSSGSASCKVISVISDQCFSGSFSCFKYHMYCVLQKGEITTSLFYGTRIKTMPRYLASVYMVHIQKVPQRKVPQQNILHMKHPTDKTSHRRNIPQYETSHSMKRPTVQNIPQFKMSHRQKVLHFKKFYTSISLEFLFMYTYYRMTHSLT